MKTLLRKTNDKAFDNLLRSHLGRPSDSAGSCSGFDPDRANAYIERGLAGVERMRYERHLSDCAGCRTSVVALARMADADSISSAVPNVARNSGVRESSWLSSLKTGWLVIASPRWAIVATALLVISISVPVFVWKGSPRPTPMAPDTDGQAPAGDKPSMYYDSQGSQVARESQESNRAGGAEPSPQITPTTRSSVEREQQRRETVAEGFASKGDVAGGLAPTQPPTEAPERKSTENAQVAADREDAKLKENTTEKATAPAAPAALAQARTEESAKINKDSALKLPAEDTSSAKVRTLKPGTIDAGPKTELEKDRVATITSKDGEAPKPKAKLESETRGSLAVGARSRALVGGESARPDRAHSPERKVGKKTFWLTRGIWTDSDYNSDQRLPVVTVVRDSDVYNELLEKNSKLKAFFKAFTGTESAIIIFKSTVYSVIPQADSK